MSRMSVSVVVALSAVWLWVGAANATLVGDAVTIGHYFPDGTTPLLGGTPPSVTTVVAGDADAYTFYNSYPFGYKVNVEANSLLVDFSYVIQPGDTATWPDSYQSCGFNGGVVECNTVLASFSGLGVSDLNDSTGNVLQGVLVDTNMAGWDLSRLSFGDDYVRFDWKGLSFQRDTYLNATMNFAAVPGPSTLLLLGTAMGGLVMRRRSLQAARTGGFLLDGTRI